KGHGLAKIIEKHLDDFKGFEGNNAYEKLGNGLEYLVKNGELISEHGINTIIGKYDQQTYRIGLSRGWNNQGDNHWIITAYKLEKSPDSDVLPSNRITKGDGTNLHPNDRVNATEKPLNSDLSTAEKSTAQKFLKSQTQPPIEPKWKALNPKYKPKLSQQARQTLLENEKKKFYKEWAKYGGKPEDQFVAVQFKIFFTSGDRLGI
uniref:putative barnase/colicin E5 family endoribonuclease n=1 Tax=Helicobacter suis TaxID=104628 RepID=UPI0013D08447